MRSRRVCASDVRERQLLKDMLGGDFGNGFSTFFLDTPRGVSWHTVIAYVSGIGRGFVDGLLYNNEKITRMDVGIKRMSE